jgi:hypothetical protein
MTDPPAASTATAIRSPGDTVTTATPIHSALQTAWLGAADAPLRLITCSGPMSWMLVTCGPPIPTAG